MQERSKKVEAEDVVLTPICEKCGNAKLWESFDSAQDRSSKENYDPEDGEWMCPHCQGEIDFLGDDDE